MTLPGPANSAMEAQENYCPRHPSTQTNLRCGRCGQLICPRCMVNSPVGARCPDCARIGRPTIMDAGASDLGRATVAALGVGLLGGIAVALIVRLLVEIPFPPFLGQLVVAIIMLGSGVPVGESIRRAANRSMDNRVRMLAGLAVFILYVTAVLISNVLGAAAGATLNLFAYIGLAMGIWTAMNRVRS